MKLSLKQKIKKYAKKLAKGAESLPESYWEENYKYTVKIPREEQIYVVFEEEPEVLEYFLKIFAKYAGKDYTNKYGSVYYYFKPYPENEIIYEYCYITRMECQHRETV